MLTRPRPAPLVLCVLSVLHIVSYGLVHADDCSVFDSALHIEATLTLPEGERASDGSLVYIVEPSGTLRIFDISTYVPNELGSLSLPQGAGPLAVASGTAYIASGLAGVQLVDVSSPQAPANLQTVDTPGTAHDLVVLGSDVIVADDAGLVIIDASTPASAVIVGSVATTAPTTLVRASGTLAYAVEQSVGEIEVIDISAPGAPSLVGSLPYPALDVEPFGTHAMVVPSMEILDVSNPTNPIVISSIPEIDWIWGPEMIRHDDVIFIEGYREVYRVFNHSNTSYGIHAIDISSPTAPSIEGSAVTRGPLVIADGQLLSDDAAVLPLDPQERDPLARVPGAGTDVAVHGHHAYLTSANTRIYDVSDPTNPMLLGNTIAGWEPFIEGGHLFMVDDSQLLVLDLSTPSSPQPVGALSVAGANDVAVIGDRAYVSGTDGLTVVDVSDRTAPAILGGVPLFNEFYQFEEEAIQVAAIGTMVLMIGIDSMALVDASNPAAPSVTWSALAGGDTHGYSDLVASDEYFYGARLHALGVNAFDPSNPTDPWAGRVASGQNYTSIAVSGTDLFVFVEGHGLNHVDVVDLANPFVRLTQPLGNEPSKGNDYTVLHPHAGGVAFHDGRVYTVTRGGLLTIWGTSCTTTSTINPEDDELAGRPSLLRVWPNPMRSQTTISLSIAPRSELVTSVYDVRGRLVWHLDSRVQSGQPFLATWNGRNQIGRPVPSGVYFVQTRWTGGTQTKAVTLVR